MNYFVELFKRGTMSVSDKFDEFRIVDTTINNVNVKNKTRTISVNYQKGKRGEIFSKELPLRNLLTKPLKPIGFHLEESFPLEEEASERFGFVQTFRKHEIPSSLTAKKGLEITHLQSGIPHKIFFPKKYAHKKKE
jgi:hypothetical protein